MRTRRKGDRATERQSYRATERQSYRATERQSYRETEGQSYRVTGLQSYRATERQRDRGTELQSDGASSADKSLRLLYHSGAERREEVKKLIRAAAAGNRFNERPTHESERAQNQNHEPTGWDPASCCTVSARGGEVVELPGDGAAEASLLSSSSSSSSSSS
ncbi:unnamed protein product [Pleuronectes platessa]|uniref:Uncharacterized protein n=1 Tax=Pleuronectes platessa TaxID=8262 RepID=A0A9N7TT97_PLEPL|nr:unnamed protein product [Pleuronectes platessa]